MAEHDEPITSVQRLLQLHDREFILAAYKSVLGRASDPDGESHYLAQLRSGTHKLAILRELRRSAEGRSFIPGVAGLDAAIKRHHWATLPFIGLLVRSLLGGEGNSHTDRQFRALTNELAVLRKSVTTAGQQTSSATNGPSPSPEFMPFDSNLDEMRFHSAFLVNDRTSYALEEFMQMHDTSFVEAAYFAILRREPDALGRKHYVRRIREGSSKIRVLSDLIRSKEGRAKGAKISGLNAAMKIEKALSFPLIGGVLYFLVFSVTIRHHLRDMRVLENHIFRLIEESHRLQRQDIRRIEKIVRNGQ